MSTVAQHKGGMVWVPGHTCQIRIPLAFSFKASVESPPLHLRSEWRTSLKH